MLATPMDGTAVLTPTVGLFDNGPVSIYAIDRTGRASCNPIIPIRVLHAGLPTPV